MFEFDLTPRNRKNRTGFGSAGIAPKIELVTEITCLAVVHDDGLRVESEFQATGQLNDG
jgi:hypothetical protein